MLSRLQHCQATLYTFSKSVTSRSIHTSIAKMAPKGVEIRGALPNEECKQILSDDALSFVAKLHRKFNPTRLQLLAERENRLKAIAAGEKLDFLASTNVVRENPSWKINPLPKDLLCRRVEITGPPTAKMIINALNSGADAYMCDFEDSNAPHWNNQIMGQVYVKHAVRKQLAFEDKGKQYKLNEKVAVMSIRPRGWHLNEKNILIDGDVTSGSLFDFGLTFYHNAKELLARGSGPYFYLPKLESHKEARLWNDVFLAAQNELGIPFGTIKATVLVETLPAAFEMEEILYELREHSAGLNAGRWDYIFSCIKTFQHDKNFVLADRGQITMTVPFMRAYALNLVKACHKRGAPAIGGMAALIPIKNDPEMNDKAMAGVKEDKRRDAADGFDGGWVAHPGLVELAMGEFKKVLGEKLNQIDKQRPDVVTDAKDLLDFRPTEPITEQGLRSNIAVGLRYLGSWLAGNGCVPIFNLMEDAATAEISRSQVWNWIHSPNGKFTESSQKITLDMVKKIIAEELKVLKNEPGYNYYEQAAKIFVELVESPRLERFLTLPLYERL